MFRPWRCCQWRLGRFVTTPGAYVTEGYYRGHTEWLGYLQTDFNREAQWRYFGEAMKHGDPDVRYREDSDPSPAVPGVAGFHTAQALISERTGRV
jgi:hypothetical protein